MWPKSLAPWCNIVLCGLNPAVGCGKPHPRLGLPGRPPEVSNPEGELHSSEPPLKHDSHFLLQKRSTIGYNLGCPEALAEAEQLMKASSDSTNSDIPFSELRVLAFDYLCFVNSSQFCIRGFETVSQACLWGSRPMALGRKQRDWALGIDTIPRLRCIDSDSPFASLCIHSAHAVSMGESVGLSKLYMASLRVAVEGEARLLKLSQQSCHSCNLSKAYHQRNDTKMKSHHLGPSGRLTALGSYPPGLSCSQVDLIGPLTYLDQMANSVKLYLLICVSYTWGVTRLIPIKSKSTESVMQGLKTLALQQSTRFELVSHDDGGEFYHTSTTFSPMEESSSQGSLVGKWFDAFEKGADQIELEGLGIWVKFGKSRQCSAAERRVADVKRVFKNFHLFQQDSEKTDLYEILFLCALVEHIIGSRPILVHGDRVYSLNTLRSLLMDTGTLACEADGVEPMDTGVRRRVKVEKLCSRLSGLRVQMTRLIMSFHLDTLLDNVHRREKVKHGKAVETIARGDIVFDGIGFEKSGNLTGSLGKVVGLGTSKNHLLIIKAAPKSRTKSGLHTQICVSRPSNELHFVCRGTGSPVAVGDLDTFNLLKYLPNADPLSTSWVFSPTCEAPLATGLQAPTSGPHDGDVQPDCEVPARESVSHHESRYTDGRCGWSTQESMSHHDNRPTATRRKLPTSKSVSRPSGRPSTDKYDLSGEEVAIDSSVNSDLGEAPTSGPSHVTKSRFGRSIRRPKRLNL